MYVRFMGIAERLEWEEIIRMDDVGGEKEKSVQLPCPVLFFFFFNFFYSSDDLSVLYYAIG